MTFLKVRPSLPQWHFQLFDILSNTKYMNLSSADSYKLNKPEHNAATKLLHHRRLQISENGNKV